MNVLAINGSPHEKGCTYTAISLVAEELKKQGIETEIVSVGVKPVQGCIACGKCKDTGRCIFDDMVNTCLEKMEKADGIIIGSPVYYSGISGQMKSFLDRFFYAGPDLRFKVGLAVTSLRRSGGVDTYHQLNNFFGLAQVITVPSVYWNVIHGTSPDETMQDLEGVQMMRTLGQNMAWLMKAVDQAKQTSPLPEQEKRIFTNFIR
ncbi:MAG: flavodoxin family protein [Oscillospiraceae bacterium]|nr:flavodoxin family protein [Oscillospiraceae bacterium]